MFNHKFRYLFIVLLGGYSYINTLFSEVYHYYKIEVPWYIPLMTILFITLTVWEVSRIIQSFANNYFKKLKPFQLLLLTYAIATILSSLLTFIIVYFIGTKYTDLSSSTLHMPIKLALMYGARVSLFLHTLNAIFFYVNAYKTKQLEAEELKRINTQAQLQSIKNQVNPHFLFNNLNVLSSLVMTDNPDANKFIEEFSTVYRHILNSQEKELIELRTELDYIKPYIFLLQKRFPDSISIVLDIPESYQNWYIVPVALQMLIENAIKHNIVSRARPLQVSIVVKGEHLIVKNNLQLKLQVEHSTQIGLQNISQRYQIITGKAIKIDKDQNSFSVSLPLIRSVI